MTLHALTKELLQPRLLQPCVISFDMIGYLYVGNSEYQRMEQSIAVFELLNTGIVTYDMTLPGHGSRKEKELFLVGKPSLDVQEYQKLIVLTANGLGRCEERSFQREANGYHTNTNLWFDFTYSREKRNCVFLTFDKKVRDKVVRILASMAERMPA